MPTIVVCPGCKARLQVAQLAPGKSIRCPACKNLIAAPLATAAASGETSKTPVPLTALHAATSAPASAPKPVAVPQASAAPMAQAQAPVAPTAVPMARVAQAVPVSSAPVQAQPVAAPGYPQAVAMHPHAPAAQAFPSGGDLTPPFAAATAGGRKLQRPRDVSAGTIKWLFRILLTSALSLVVVAAFFSLSFVLSLAHTGAEVGHDQRQQFERREIGQSSSRMPPATSGADALNKPESDPVVLNIAWGFSAIVLLPLAGVSLLILPITFILLLYKMWALIQDGRARTTPMKAVLLLFVPTFRFYWNFVAIGSLAENLNRFAVRHHLEVRRASSSLAKSFCWLTILTEVLSSIGYLAIRSMTQDTAWLVFVAGISYFLAVLAFLANLFVLVLAMHSMARAATDIAAHP